MEAGRVVLDADGNATASGMAKALYEADIATMDLPAAVTVGSTSAPYSAARPASQADADAAAAARVRVLKEAARQATAYAEGLVAYLQEKAVAVVPADATGDGLQSGTTHPEVEKEIPIR